MIARPDAGARVLLLLPEGAAASALRGHLRAAGHEVAMVRTAAETVQTITRVKLHALVADAALVPEGVPALVAACVQREAALAVVVAGAPDDAGAAVRCLRAGAVDYLGDLTDPDAVERAVSDAIARRRELVQEQNVRRVLRDEVASLVGELRLERNRVESLSLATLESLVRVVETKDAWLGGHSVRVAQLAASLAAEMGRSDPEIEAVRLAGRLHDIGMICLGDGILSKEGPLTAAEFEQVKRHVVIGHQIIEPLPHFGMVSAFVRSHHERWDGDGYPDRLAGDEIPWGALLIAAAEIYDALTTVRPYRKAVSPEEAVESMRELAGAAICPLVFAALSDVVSRREALVFVDDHSHEPGATVQEVVAELATGRRGR
jgi:putative two-component system response regulator